MTEKDFFSNHAKIYAAFRPTYPQALYDFIFSQVKEKTTAWDCATGNGQVAQSLAGTFKKVIASDLSAKQIENAARLNNIEYVVSPAETTPFSDNQFDLITVGQALHWIDVDRFYAEVKRTGKPGAVISVWGYALLKISDQIDNILIDFYKDIVGPFWDDARKHVDDRYEHIPFPFKETVSREFQLPVHWSKNQLAGYLTSWSAVQNYIKQKEIDPVPSFMKAIDGYWGKQIERAATFPIFLKLGFV